MLNRDMRKPARRKHNFLPQSIRSLPQFFEKLNMDLKAIKIIPEWIWIKETWLF